MNLFLYAEKAKKIVMTNQMIRTSFDESAGRTPEQARLHRLLQRYSGPSLMELLSGDGSPEAIRAAALQLGTYFEATQKSNPRAREFRLSEWNEMSREARLELLEYIWCHFEPGDETCSSASLACCYEETGGPLSCFQLVPALLLSGYLPMYNPSVEDYCFAVSAEGVPPFQADFIARATLYKSPRVFVLSDTFRASVEGQQLLQRWETLADFNFPE